MGQLGFGLKMLKQLLNKRNSIRKFLNKSVKKEFLEKLLWAGYGKAKLGRTVPSAGACYPLRLFILEKKDGFSYYNAPACIVIMADFKGIVKRYGQRGYRYAYIETGHVAQNITLQAIELGLGTVMIGAFNQRKLKGILGVEGELIYIIPVGYGITRKD